MDKVLHDIFKKLNKKQQADLNSCFKQYLTNLKYGTATLFGAAYIEKSKKLVTIFRFSDSGSLSIYGEDEVERLHYFLSDEKIRDRSNIRIAETGFYITEDAGSEERVMAKVEDYVGDKVSFTFADERPPAQPKKKSKKKVSPPKKLAVRAHISSSCAHDPDDIPMEHWSAEDPVPCAYYGAWHDSLDFLGEDSPEAEEQREEPQRHFFVFNRLPKSEEEINKAIKRYFN